MKILHIVAGLEESNGMANTARQFAEEERAQGHESAVTNDLSALDATIDVVHLHGAWLPILWRAAKMARRLGAKLIIRPAGSYDPVRLAYHSWKKRLVSFFEHRMLLRADVIQATCRAEVDWIRAYEPRVRKIELTDLKRFFRLGDCGIERLGDCGIEGLGDCEIERLRDCGIERLDMTKSNNPTIRQSDNHTITQSPNHPIAQSDNPTIIQSPNHPITQSPNHPIAQSPNHPITQSHNPRPLHVLYLGRRHPLKGLEYLEAAVEEILSGCRSSDVECPTPPPVELRIVSNAFGEEKERVWEWCDVLVLPTLSENFGRVVAEALERGKRVITTDGAPAWGEGLRDCGIEGLRDCGIERLDMTKSNNPPIRQSDNPTILQSANHAITQSYSPTVLQSANPPIRQSDNPTILQSANPTILQSHNPTIKQSLNGRILRGYGGRLYYLVGYREGSCQLRIQLLKRAIWIVGLGD